MSDTISLEIESLDQWIVWSTEGSADVRRPYNANLPGEYASVADPSTWSSFERALATYDSFDRIDGIGFVFTSSDPYVGIDFDNVARGEDDLEPWVWEIVERIDSYSEWSPSGQGVHVIARDEQEVVERASKTSKLEIYPRSRFFTFTYHSMATTPDSIGSRSGELRWLYDRYEDELTRKLPDEQQMTVHSSTDQVDPDLWVDQALDAIDPDCSYREWCEIVGMGLHAIYGGNEEGFNKWVEWSRSGSKFDENAPNQMRSHWASFDDQGGRSGKSIWWLAENEYGWSYRSQHETSIDLESWINDSDDTPTLDESVEVPDDPPIRCHDYAETYADDSEYEDYLIDPNVLGESDLMVEFGPPKSMKTLCASGMARQFAANEPWMGFEPTRQLTSLYLNFEVKADAWRERSHRLELDDDILEKMHGHYMFTSKFVDEISDDSMERILDTVAYYLHGEGKLQDVPDILWIDPAINFFHGDDENDNSQVMEFVELLRLLAERISPSCAIVLVTHTSKVKYEDDPFRNLRGASAYRGAYDTGLYLDKSEHDVVEIMCETRNSPADLGPYQIVIGADGRFRELPDNIEPRKWAQLRDKIEEDAKRGVVYQKTDLIEECKEKLSFGGEHRMLERLDTLLDRHILGYFDPQPYGGPQLPNRSEGYLCTSQMAYSPEQGVEVEVSDQRSRS